MDDLAEIRRDFARSLTGALPGADPRPRRALEGAFAAVAREDFLGPPPWRVRQPADLGAVASTADPRALYRDALVDLDAERNIYNGLPSLWVGVFCALRIAPGERAVHVGSGTGYYSAILAELVGAAGQVVALEVEPHLAARARAALSRYAQVAVVQGDGATWPRAPADVVVVNAGATRIAEAWLAGLAPAGRLYVPLTVSPQDPIGGIGVGAGFVVERRERGAFGARCAGLVGIYPCRSAREAASHEALHAALSRGPDVSARVRSLRRDAHPPDDACWCHVEGACLSLRDPA